MRHVLIDYENIQPTDISRLGKNSFSVHIFIGQAQAKISSDLVIAGQHLDHMEFIKISGNGPNALDFHIAFYIGQLAAKEPDSTFLILSRDKGFDPLIEHLDFKGIKVKRARSIDEVLILPKSQSASRSRIDAISADLRQRGQSRPATLKALIKTINNNAKPKMTEDEALKIVDELKSNGTITVNKNKISYKF